MEITELLFIGLFIVILIGIGVWKHLSVERLRRDGWRCDVVHVDGCTPKRVWYKP